MQEACLVHVPVEKSGVEIEKRASGGQFPVAWRAFGDGFAEPYQFARRIVSSSGGVPDPMQTAITRPSAMQYAIEGSERREAIESAAYACRRLAAILARILESLDAAGRVGKNLHHLPIDRAQAIG